MLARFHSERDELLAAMLATVLGLGVYFALQELLAARRRADRLAEVGEE